MNVLLLLCALCCASVSPGLSEHPAISDNEQNVTSSSSLMMAFSGGGGGGGGGGHTRRKRSVFHLVQMMTCAVPCNPLDYKGYGCYCGFLGSGIVVDGIDKCCKGHDWCYENARCKGLDHYFTPYKWKCNGGSPYCDAVPNTTTVTIGHSALSYSCTLPHTSGLANNEDRYAVRRLEGRRGNEVSHAQRISFGDEKIEWRRLLTNTMNIERLTESV